MVEGGGGKKGGPPPPPPSPPLVYSETNLTTSSYIHLHEASRHALRGLAPATPLGVTVYAPSAPLVDTVYAPFSPLGGNVYAPFSPFRIPICDPFSPFGGSACAPYIPYTPFGDVVFAFYNPFGNFVGPGKNTQLSSKPTSGLSGNYINPLTNPCGWKGCMRGKEMLIESCPCCLMIMLLVV